MGAGPSVTNSILPFTNHSQLSSEEMIACETSWQVIISSESPPPEAVEARGFKSYRLWFYSLCYGRLRRKIEEEPETPPRDPNALHTIVIFMLKLMSIYLTSLKSKKAFEKYAKSLSLSSSHLGIRVRDYSLFEDSFLTSIEQCFDDATYQSWKKLFGLIMKIVIPECAYQEQSTSMKRQLRLSGNGNLRDAPENEVVSYYAEYAFKLISTMSNDDNDVNSVNSRLSTSLHNSIENEYEDASRVESSAHHR